MKLVANENLSEALDKLKTQVSTEVRGKMTEYQVKNKNLTTVMLSSFQGPSYNIIH